MHATKDHVAEASVSPYDPKIETQLDFITTEKARNYETWVKGHGWPFRHKSAGALRGFKFMDVTALVLGFMMAWGVALLVNAVFFGHINLNAVHDGFTTIIQSLLLGMGVIVRSAPSGHYRRRMPFWTEMKKIVEAMALALLMDVFIRFIIKQDFSRIWLFSGWFFAAANIVLLRTFWRKHILQKGIGNIATLLVGAGKTDRDTRQALESEPGMTHIGIFLRRTSIDEMPQLLNVLKGEMSLVGPRPIIVAEAEKHSSDISHYYRVRPGITGLWQVSGHNDVS